MIKKFVFTALAMGLVNIALASTNTTISHSSVGFEPHSWSSTDVNDVITLQTNDNGLGYAVEIYVSNSFSAVKPDGVIQGAGANVTNCGAITHIKPGTSVVCKLTVNQPVSFSSDQPSSVATGVYQISSK